MTNSYRWLYWLQLEQNRSKNGMEAKMNAPIFHGYDEEGLAVFEIDPYDENEPGEAHYLPAVITGCEGE